MKTNPLLIHPWILGLSIVWLSIDAGLAQDAPAFKSIIASRAQDRYQETVAAASKRFTDELDRNLKFALQSGALEEANQINAAKQQAATGEAVTVELQRNVLVTARNQYRDTLAAAKGQYFRDLEPALREATKAGDLQEANAIDAVRKGLESELADGKITGKVENGLWLTMGGQRKVWENKAIVLPSNQTQVTLHGVLLLSGKVRTVKLRSAQAGGSERLRFTADGRKLDFEMEGSHRFVTASPLPGSDKIRLQLGDSISANEYTFGPLEWSINDGAWREIPLRSLVAVD
jgi:hypothetical protein